jgi:ABC-type lipoprotein export system ATPase subunit
MSDVVIRAENIRKTYRLGRVRVPVLKGASIDVRRGEWVAILGASGSGKSTLLHLLGDLDRPDPDSGQISFDDRSLNVMSRSQRNRYRTSSVGFVFQFYHLFPELTVVYNALLPGLVAESHRHSWVRIPMLIIGIAGALTAATLGIMLPLQFEKMPLWASIMWWIAGVVPLAIVSGVAAAAPVGIVWTELRSLVVRFGPRFATLKSRALELLSAFGLDHRLNHRPRELSGGERQRVAIARALVNEPQVLLADEPTGNLDERTGAEILDLLAKENERGLTIVMVTHDASVAARADRIVHLKDGRVASS